MVYVLGNKLPWVSCSRYSVTGKESDKKEANYKWLCKCLTRIMVAFDKEHVAPRINMQKHTKIHEHIFKQSTQKSFSGIAKKTFTRMAC